MAQKIDIKYSCDRNWQSLTPADNNLRHCEGCNKLIKDLSNDSEPDINGVHCGHFSIGQIGSIHSQVSLKSIGTLTLSLIGLLNLQPNTATAQEKTELTEPTPKKKSSELITISGVVKDRKSGELMPFVNVELFHSGKSVATTVSNMEGEFSLKGIDTSQYDLSEIYLQFSSIGFKTDTIKSEQLSKLLTDKDLVIDMETVFNLPDSIIVGKYHLTGIVGVAEDEPEQIKIETTTPNNH